MLDGAKERPDQWRQSPCCNTNIKGKTMCQRARQSFKPNKRCQAALYSFMLGTGSILCYLAYRFEAYSEKAIVENEFEFVASDRAAQFEKETKSLISCTFFVR